VRQNITVVGAYGRSYDLMVDRKERERERERERETERDRERQRETESENACLPVVALVDFLLYPFYSIWVPSIWDDACHI
jgi:hypothetical protein